MSTYSQYRIAKPTGFDSLKLHKDLEIPSPGKGDVLIKVRACSLNYRDLILAKGNYPCKEDVCLISFLLDRGIRDLPSDRMDQEGLDQA